MIFVTSLSPSLHSIELQRNAIQSWKKLKVPIYSINSFLDDINTLKIRYPEVEFIETKITGQELFGKPYIFINDILDKCNILANDIIFLINSDIIIETDIKKLNYISRTANNGLVFISRYNFKNTINDAVKENWGIDGFVFHKKFISCFKKKNYVLGLPWWDYWFPYTFVHNKIPTYYYGQKFIYHKLHKLNWNQESWIKQSELFINEFKEIKLKSIQSEQYEYAKQVYNLIIKNSYNMENLQTDIYSWINKLLYKKENPLIIEIGAHNGSDSVKLSNINKANVHSFEPDPRNIQIFQKNERIKLNEFAVSDKNGEIYFILSKNYGDKEWTYSSSIKQPKNHLDKYPKVGFGDSIKVKTITLDKYCKDNNIKEIDFLWMDVQGAEGEVLDGAKNILKNTKYLFTEYSDNEMYEGQITLTEILNKLEGWSILEKYNEDVLLINNNIK